MTTDIEASIAVTRFGLGGLPGEIAAARSDPRGYLVSQITPTGLSPARPDAPGSAVRLADLQAFNQLRKTARMEGDPKSDPVKMAQMGLREDAEGDFLARVRLGASTNSGFAERWALFWANHFTVSAVKTATAPLVGPFEDEAIRPHAFGRFEDMLVASSRHPAMLLYLDQAQSIADRRRAVRRRAARRLAARSPGRLAGNGLLRACRRYGLPERERSAEPDEQTRLHAERARLGFGHGGGHDLRASDDRLDESGER